MWFLSILVILLGAVNIFVPEIGWYISYGWRYKNAEPSNVALSLGRISGVILTVVGIGILVS